MTKLTQWLFCIILFLSLWLALIKGYTPIDVNDDMLLFVYLVNKSDNKLINII